MMSTVSALATCTRVGRFLTCDTISHAFGYGHAARHLGLVAMSVAASMGIPQLVPDGRRQTGGLHDQARA